MAGVQDLYNGLVSALGIPNNMALGRRELARNVDFPFIWVVPARESYGVPQGPGASGNPRVLHRRTVELEIHTWGGDYGITEDLHESVITALRGVVGGANYTINGAEWVEAADMGRQNVLVMNVSINLNATQKTLPVPLPLGPDATLPTIPFPPVNFDTQGSVPGDSKLDAGENP